MTITNDIVYVGVNDRVTDLFEGQYKIPNGISYNSYVILDEKIAVMDSVDASFGEEWLDNIEGVLGDRKPDYLVVSHMEPDPCMVDGVSFRSLIFLGKPDKHGSREQLFYWDRQKEVPAFQSGEPVTLKYTGKMIIGYGTP